MVQLHSYYQMFSVVEENHSRGVCFHGCLCVCQVAKSHGDPETQKQVAYMWARSLGGEAAVKLLSKFGLLEYAIEMASNKK